MKYYTRVIWIVLLMVIGANGLLEAQVGKEFWFAAPDVTESHIGSVKDKFGNDVFYKLGAGPVAFRLTALDKDALVTISMPAGGGLQTFTVTVPAYQQITISSDDPSFSAFFPDIQSNGRRHLVVENSPLNTVNEKGILIQSTENITALYEVMNKWNPDVFTLKGNNALGTKFFVPSQNTGPNHDGNDMNGKYVDGVYYQPYEQVNIVATEDNTEITIVPTADLLNSSVKKGDTLTINLDKGESYSFSPNNWNTSGVSLAGTAITSNNKNIAVTVSDDSVDKTAGNGYDLIGDQLVPTSVIGTDYIAMRSTTDLSNLNRVFVIATEDNTLVTRTSGGNTFTETLNKGTIQHYDIPGSDFSMQIKTSSPAYVYQMSGIGNELGSALLPTVSGCTGSSRVSITRNFKEAFWVQILTVGDNLTGSAFKALDANGQNIGVGLTGALNTINNWRKVGTSNFYTLTLNLSDYKVATGQTVAINNDKGLFHLSVLDQNDGSMSYGYYSSYNSVSIDGLTQACVSDGVELTAKDLTGTYEWTSNVAGFTPVTSSSIKVNQSGRYYLTRKSVTGCLAKDSTDVTITEPIFNMPNPGTVCPNTQLTLKVTPATGNTYEWYDGTTLVSSTDSLEFTPVAGQTKTFSVTATSTLDKCTSTKSTQVVTVSSPQADLTSVGDSICAGEKIENSTSLINYRWKLNGTSMPAFDNLPYIIATVTGLYEVQGESSEGCVSKSTKQVRVNSVPVVKINDQTVCSNTNAVFNVIPESNTTYTWVSDTGPTGTSYTKNSAGTLIVKATNASGCISRDTALVSWNAIPTVALSYSIGGGAFVNPDPFSEISSCTEKSVVFQVPNSYSSYSWTPSNDKVNITTPITIAAGATQKVKIVVTDSKGCMAADSVNLKGYPKTTITTDKLEYCVGETMQITTPSLSNWQWISATTNNVISNATTLVASNTELGGYKVIALDGNQCSTTTANVAVNPLPAVALSGPKVCEGSPFIFTGEPLTGVSYAWSQPTVPNEAKSYDSSTFSVTANALTWLEVEDQTTKCKARASAMPSWNQPPQTNISYNNSNLGTVITSDDISVCPKTTITIDGTATSLSGASVSYQWFVDGIDQNKNSPTIGVSGPDAGADPKIVRLIVKDTYGCTAEDIVRLIALPDPKNIFLGSDQICKNEELSVESYRTSLRSHFWTTPSGINSSAYTITAGLGGIYKLDITDNNGCSASRDYIVHDPTITLATAKVLTTCSGTTPTLSVVADPLYTYTWSDSTFLTLGNQSSFIPTIPGTYYVRGQNSIGCSDTSSVTLKWAPSKLIDIGASYSVCPNPVPTTIVGIVDPLFTDYKWYMNGVVIAGANSSSYTIPWGTVAINSTAAFTVTAIYDKAGINCPITQNFTFEVLNLMNPLTFKSLNICEGSSISLQANMGFTSYEWFTVVGGSDIPTGVTSPTYPVSTSGTYKLKAEQPNGCKAEGTNTVTVTPMPVKNFVIPTQTCSGESVKLENLGTAAYGYKWVYNGKVVDIDNSFTYSKTGTYSVLINDIAKPECYIKVDWENKPPVKPAINLTDKTICSNASVNLDDQLTLPIADYVSHEWYLNGAKINTPANTTGAYELWLTVKTDGYNCTHKYTFNLTVVQIPTFTGLVTDYTICDGGTAILDGTGISPTVNYYNYQWSFTSSAVPPVVIPPLPNTRTIEASDAGTYRVTAVVLSGATQCSNTSAPITLDVNSNPQITITPDRDYLCVGGSVNLTASNSSGIPTKYVWDTGGGKVMGASLNVNKKGIYTVEGTDDNTCKNIAVANVIDYEPTDVILQPFAICYKDTMTLPALPEYPAPGGVTSFRWYKGNANSADAGDPDKPWKFEVTEVGDITYVLNYLTEPNGCWIQKSYILKVLPLPSITKFQPANNNFCDGDALSLDAGSGNYNYLWSRSGTPSVVVGNSNTYSPKTSGTYKVVATSNEGCSSTDSATVVFNANPVVVIGNDTTVCQGVPYTLSVKNSAGLHGYIWSTSSADDGKSSITRTNDGTYSVIAYNVNNCSDTATIDVKVHPQTQVVLDQLKPVCDNSTTTLTSPLAVGPQILSYQWYYGSVGGMPQGKLSTPWTPDPPLNGLYFLEVTDLNNCKAFGSTEMKIIASPDVNLGADRQSCVMDTLKIPALLNYVRYTWNGNSNDSLNYKLVDPSIPVYILEVEDRNGCTASDTVKITPNPLPVPYLGEDIVKCPGETVLTPAGGPYNLIEWSTGDLSATLIATTGPYSVKVTDARGCIGSDEVNIAWLEQPKPIIVGDEVICQTVVDYQISTEEKYVNYLWHNNSTDSTTIADIAPDLSWVNVIAANGCPGRGEKRIERRQSPDYHISPDTTLCANYTYTLDAGKEYPFVIWSTGWTGSTLDLSANKDTTYTVFLEASDNCVIVYDTVVVKFNEMPQIAKLDTMIYAQINIDAKRGLPPYMYSLNQGNLQASNAFKYLSNGVYEAYVEDANKCWDIDSVTINSVLDIDIPNFFTPNRDGYNDSWVVNGLQDRFPDANIIIYDRYNRQIIRLKGDGDGWDGTYLGKDMPSDDYWFVINLVHVNKTLKGNITLKR